MSTLASLMRTSSSKKREDEEDAQPEEPPEPEWPDIINGPLTAEEEIQCRSPIQATRDSLMPRSGLSVNLRRKSYRKVWEFVQYINTNVATSHWSQEWLLHPLVGFQRLLSAMLRRPWTKEQRQDPEPWKIEELRNFMRLSRLRVGLRASQLLMFGFASPRDDIPAVPECKPLLPSVCANESNMYNSIFHCGVDKKGHNDPSSPIPHTGRSTAIDYLAFCGILENMILSIHTE